MVVCLVTSTRLSMSSTQDCMTHKSHGHPMPRIPLCGLLLQVQVSWLGKYLYMCSGSDISSHLHASRNMDTVYPDACPATCSLHTRICCWPFQCIQWCVFLAQCHMWSGDCSQLWVSAISDWHLGISGLSPHASARTFTHDDQTSWLHVGSCCVRKHVIRLRIAGWVCLCRGIIHWWLAVSLLG